MVGKKLKILLREEKAKKKKESRSRGSRESRESRGSTDKKSSGTGRKHRRKRRSRKKKSRTKMKIPKTICFESNNWYCEGYILTDAEVPAPPLKSALADNAEDSSRSSSTTKLQVKFNEEDPTLHLIPTLDEMDVTDLFVSPEEIEANQQMDIKRQQILLQRKKQEQQNAQKRKKK